MEPRKADVASGRARSEVQIVRAMFEAFARRDVEAALERVHPRMQLTVPGTAVLAGRSGPYVGHDGLRRYFDDVTAIWDELTVTALDYRAVAGSVVVFGRVRARRGADRLDTAAIWTWRVQDGLVISGAAFPTPDGGGPGTPAHDGPEDGYG
jgi:ketosteroid isomerase-like protein